MTDNMDTAVRDRAVASSSIMAFGMLDGIQEIRRELTADIGVTFQVNGMQMYSCTCGYSGEASVAFENDREKRKMYGAYRCPSCGSILYAGEVGMADDRIPLAYREIPVADNDRIYASKIGFTVLSVKNGMAGIEECIPESFLCYDRDSGYFLGVCEETYFPATENYGGIACSEELEFVGKDGKPDGDCILCDLTEVLEDAEIGNIAACGRYFLEANGMGSIISRYARLINDTEPELDNEYNDIMDIFNEMGFCCNVGWYRDLLNLSKQGEIGEYSAYFPPADGFIDWYREACGNGIHMGEQSFEKAWGQPLNRLLRYHSIYEYYNDMKLMDTMRKKWGCADEDAWNYCVDFIPHYKWDWLMTASEKSGTDVGSIVQYVMEAERNGYPADEVLALIKDAYGGDLRKGIHMPDFSSQYNNDTCRCYQLVSSGCMTAEQYHEIAANLNIGAMVRILNLV